MKTDLLHLLPLDLQESLMWHADDGSVSFERYRAHVQSTANKVLKLRSRRRGMNLVEGDYEEGTESSAAAGESIEDGAFPEELLAMAQTSHALRARPPRTHRTSATRP